MKTRMWFFLIIILILLGLCSCRIVHQHPVFQQTPIVEKPHDVCVSGSLGNTLLYGNPFCQSFQLSYSFTSNLFLTAQSNYQKDKRSPLLSRYYHVHKHKSNAWGVGYFKKHNQFGVGIAYLNSYGSIFLNEFSNINPNEPAKGYNLFETSSKTSSLIPYFIYDHGVS